jgi:class 3 adenylate cyclase
LTDQSAGVLATIPAGVVRKAFDREVRIGTILTILARILTSLQAWIRWIMSDRANVTKHSLFHGLDVIYTCGFVRDVLLIVVLVVITRTKRPLLWLAIAVFIDLAYLTEFKFWYWHFPFMPTYPSFVNVAYLDILDYWLILAICALPLSRVFLLGTGASCFLIFGIGVVLAFVDYGHGTLYWAPFGSGASEADFRLLQDPETLVPDYLILQLAGTGVFTWFLVQSVQEGRQFVTIRANAEASLAFFAKFFPPAVADRISREGNGRIRPAKLRTAIAFVDILERTDEADFDRLQDYYVWVEAQAFANDGVIDRYSGGPIMLSFGAVEQDAFAVKKAFDFALALQGAPERLRVVLHYGEAVSGEFGGTRSRTFSVVGDVANTARRILDVADKQDFAFVVTQDVIAALPPDYLTPAIEKLPTVQLRGRTSPIELWRVSV